MKKAPYHLFLTIPCILFGLLLAAVLFLRQLGVLLWLPFGSTRELAVILSCLFTVLLLGWLALWLWHRTKAAWGKCIIVILLVSSLLLSGAIHVVSYVINFTAVDYEMYTSLDGRYTVVLELQAHYHTKTCDVYIMTSPVTMKKLGTCQWDIATEPTVTWEGDHVAVRGDGKTKHFCLED